MLTMREAVGVTAVIVGAATLAAVSHHAGGQGTHARHAVEAAAHRLTYQQLADAWNQTKLGDTAALTTIRQGVPLRYLATHQEGDAIILTFASRAGACVDLVARPDSTVVRDRRGC
jgi:hypothetical protein